MKLRVMGLYFLLYLLLLTYFLIYRDNAPHFNALDIVKYVKV